MRENKTLLHRLKLWAQDTPDAPAHYFKDSNDRWKNISAKALFIKMNFLLLLLSYELDI